MLPKKIDGYSVNNIDNIAKVDDSNYLVETLIDCDCIVESYSNATEIAELEEEGDFFFEVIERDGDEWLIQTLIELKVHLCVLYNRESSMAESIQIDYIDDYTCLFCSE